MQNLKDIKAIVFDAYGTLFDVASIDKRLQHHFGEKAGLIAPVWRRKQLEYTWLRSLMGRHKNFYGLTEDALLYACKQFGLGMTSSVVEDLMNHYYELDTYPDVAPALTQLQKNYKLAILSNANPKLLEKAVTHNQIKDRFAAIFSVESIQQYKPKPAVYQIPVDGFRLSREEIVFLSSNTWDVAGAKSFGLKVIWVKRKSGQLEELGVLPDGMVADLGDFVRQLGENVL